MPLCNFPSIFTRQE